MKMELVILLCGILGIAAAYPRLLPGKEDGECYICVCCRQCISCTICTGADCIMLIPNFAS